MEGISEQTIANLFPNYDRKLNRKPIESRGQRGKNTRMIKIYIQSTLSNMSKLDQIEQKPFFLSLFYVDIQSESFFSGYWIILLLDVAFVDIV